MAEEQDDYADYAKQLAKMNIAERLRARIAAKYPVGIIPRRQPKPEIPGEMPKPQGAPRPKPAMGMRPLRRRLRPAIRYVRQPSVNKNLRDMAQLIKELKEFRKLASKPEKIIEETPVTRAMEKQVQWLAKYNAGVTTRETLLKKYRKELKKKQDQKKPEYQIKRVKRKIDALEDLATPYNNAHQEFITSRRDFGNCICPQHGQTFDQWIRDNAFLLGLEVVAHETPRGHKGAMTRAERNKIAQSHVREPLAHFTKTMAGSPLERQQRIDYLRIHINDLVREKERLEGMNIAQVVREREEQEEKKIAEMVRKKGLK